MLYFLAQLTPSLWTLAIHGHNSKIIHFLEDNHVEIKPNSYEEVFYESIKCHHKEIENYFINNFLQKDEENSEYTIDQCLKYYNFTFLKKESLSKSSFCTLCKYDYLYICR